MTLKSGWSTKMTKWGLPVETTAPSMRSPPPSGKFALGYLRHAHGRGDLKAGPGAAVDAADSAAGIGFENDLVARAGLGFVGDPGGGAASPIAGYFGDGAVGIVQAYCALAFAFPGEKLHPVGPYAVVAVAQSSRQVVPGLRRRRDFPG